MGESDPDLGFRASGIPGGLRAALYGDPRERETAKAQLRLFGCLQVDTGPLWDSRLGELWAEVEREEGVAI